MKDAIRENDHAAGPAATVRNAIIAVLATFLVTLPPLHLASPSIAPSPLQQALIAAVLVSVGTLGTVLFWLERVE